MDVQDNRLEAEVSAWGLVEVERDDASQLKGWGSHEFRGLQHEGRWYQAAALGAGVPAVSTVIQESPSCGRSLPSSWSNRARTPLGLCCGL